MSAKLPRKPAAPPKTEKQRFAYGDAMMRAVMDITEEHHMQPDDALDAMLQMSIHIAQAAFPGDGEAAFELAERLIEGLVHYAPLSSQHPAGHA